MELHIAIKNLAKYQGKDFLTDDKFINALADFQAYEQNPALKGILKIIVQENYIKKLSKCSAWDASAQKFVIEIVQNYAMDSSLVMYAMQSVAYGLDLLTVEPSLDTTSTSPSPQTQQQTQQGQVPQSKPAAIDWKKMTQEQREDYLNSLVEIQSSTLGTIDSIYLVPNENDDKEFDINYEVFSTIKYTELHCAIYDNNGRLRSHNRIGYFINTNRKYTSSSYSYYRVKKENIACIVFYLQNNCL